MSQNDSCRCTACSNFLAAAVAVGLEVCEVFGTDLLGVRLCSNESWGFDVY
jgi:hypothetical protein